MTNSLSEQIRAELCDVLEEMQQALLSMQDAVCREKRSQSEKEDADLQFSLSVPFAQVIASKITALERYLLLYADAKKIKREEVLEPLANGKLSEDISIVFIRQLDQLAIRLPYLPHRSRKESLVIQALATKLFKAKELPRWKSCQMKFIHVYPSATRKIPRDNDNYQYKRAIDLITYALGCPDNPVCFDYSVKTAFTDDHLPGTYIIISPKSSENAELLTLAQFQHKEKQLEKSQT